MGSRSLEQRHFPRTPHREFHIRFQALQSDLSDAARQAQAIRAAQMQTTQDLSATLLTLMTSHA